MTKVRLTLSDAVQFVQRLFRTVQRLRADDGCLCECANRTVFASSHANQQCIATMTNNGGGYCRCDAGLDGLDGLDTHEFARFIGL